MSVEEQIDLMQRVGTLEKTVKKQSELIEKLLKAYNNHHHYLYKDGINETVQHWHMADYVLVMNVGGYWGKSTQSEIDYAQKIGKPVKFIEPLKEDC